MPDHFRSFLPSTEEHAIDARATLIRAVADVMAVLADRKAGEWYDAAEWYDGADPEWRRNCLEALRLLQDVERQMARSLGIVS